jgi:hypothetical protein
LKFKKRARCGPTPSSPTINPDNFSVRENCDPRRLQLGLKREWDRTESPQWVESGHSTTGILMSRPAIACVHRKMTHMEL